MLYVAFLSFPTSPCPSGGRKKRIYDYCVSLLLCLRQYPLLAQTSTSKSERQANPSSPISRQSPRFHSCDFQISISFMSQKCQNLLPLKSIASRERRSRRIEASGTDNTRSTHYRRKKRKENIARAEKLRVRLWREFCFPSLCRHRARRSPCHRWNLNRTFETTQQPWGCKSFSSQARICHRLSAAMLALIHFFLSCDTTREVNAHPNELVFENILEWNWWDSSSSIDLLRS